MKRLALLLLLGGCSNELALELDSTTLTSPDFVRMRIANGTSKEAVWSPCDQRFEKDGAFGPRVACNLSSSIPAWSTSNTLGINTPEEPGVWTFTVTVDHDGKRVELSELITILNAP